MQVSASLVKELRDRTGAGMMECKRALVAVQGNLDEAVEFLRKSGTVAAEKKSSRIAAEGIIAIALTKDERTGVMVEVNCETDFVAKGENFQEFAQEVATLGLEAQPADLEALNVTMLPRGMSVDERRHELVASIGENIAIRRFDVCRCVDGLVGAYSHGGRIGVLVELEGEGTNAEVAKDIAMHVAASAPLCVSERELPAEVLEKERVIFAAQAADSGKPEAIIEKMISGRLQKFVKEKTLLGQAFVKNPEQSVEDYLHQHSAITKGFTRYEVGEGIEKRADDFVEEVARQVGLNS